MTSRYPEGADPSNPSLNDWQAAPQVYVHGHPIEPVVDANTDRLWRNVGRLEYKKQSSSSFLHATGTLVYTGKAVGILTCAHALWDRATQALVPHGTFTAAFGSLGEPRLAPIPFTAANMFVSRPYTLSPLARYDWLAIRVPRELLPPGLDPATMPLLTGHTLAEITNEVTGVRVTGYPGPSTVMYYSIGTAFHVIGDDALIGHDASTLPGSSGSGVFLADGLVPGTPDLIAVHHGRLDQGPFNAAVLLTEDIASSIKGFLDYMP